MSSIRDIRKHISAVKNIKQITYAMKMISSARIKKAQNQILSFKPYSEYLEKVVFSLEGEFGEDDIKKSPLYRFLRRDDKTKSIGIVVISGDKGLCGSFNNLILNRALKLIKENMDKKIYLILVGKKSVDFFKKLKDIEIYYQMANIFPKVDYKHSSILSSKIIECYDKYNLDEVKVVYSEFKSLIKQEFKTVTLLPVIKSVSTEGHKKDIGDFYFEPDKKLLLENLIPKYINISVLKMLLENQTSELSARMNAMELASKNASELIDFLTLKMNKLRQAQITTELNEIISGANSINQN